MLRTSRSIVSNAPTYASVRHEILKRPTSYINISIQCASTGTNERQGKPMIHRACSDSHKATSSPAGVCFLRGKKKNYYCCSHLPEDTNTIQLLGTNAVRAALRCEHTLSIGISPDLTCARPPGRRTIAAAGAREIQHGQRYQCRDAKTVEGRNHPGE